MSFYGAMMLDSYVDWEARSDSSDGQGGYTRTFATAVRLLASFAPELPSADVLADQLSSRARGTIIMDPGENTVHEGDLVTTPDSRVWDVRSVAPFTGPGMPLEAADVLLLTVVEVEGN